MIMRGNDTWMFHLDVTSVDSSYQKNSFKGPVHSTLLVFFYPNSGAAT